MTQLVERGTLMKVLDHGYIRIVDFMGKDENIVEAARMSTGKGFISWDPYTRCDVCGDVMAFYPEDGKQGFWKQPGGCGGQSGVMHKWTKAPNGDLGLMDTLWRKNHATPFEMGELVIEVQAPLFVFREWHRHRTLSYNEFSARYAVMPNLHYLPEASRIQKQSTANKQSSAETMPEEFASDFLRECEGDQEKAYIQYEEWCDAGVAKEIARINTPVSRYSKMRAKGNLRNWFQFLNLRMRPDAQFEIRQYAIELGKMISWLWPKAYNLFEEYTLYGAHFSRSELKAMRALMFSLEELLSKHCEGGTPDIQTLIRDTSAKFGLTGTKLKEFEIKLADGGERVL